VSDSPPPSVHTDFPLSGLATVRTGGHAELFARAGSEARLVALLEWAAHAALEVNVVGSGSNLIVADEGVSGLVLKLDGQLATIELDGRALICGGGARLPSVAAHAARQGLSGIEFGVNIPGTVGGAVRMNANAYGGALVEVLDYAQIVTASGCERRTPDQLDFDYRSSNLRSGEIVARARFSLVTSDPATVNAFPDARSPPQCPTPRDQDVWLNLQESRVRPTSRRSHRRAASV
jgi:UDP-N-acetylenolpyruvoylglucosamine reductase